MLTILGIGSSAGRHTISGAPKLSAIALAVVLGLSASSCGSDDGGPTTDVLAGKYSATFAYTATLGPPFSLSDARSCEGIVTIDDEVDGEFSGHFAIVDDTCLLEPESGDISGTVDADGNVAVVGLYATTVQFELYECGISGGSTLMSGRLTDAGFSVDASATFGCSARGFDPVDVFTELTVTAVLQ